MTIERTSSRYELLIRFAEDGSVKGAHQIHQTIVRDTETDEVLSHQIGNAQTVDPADVADVLGEHGAAITAQATAAAAERDAAVAERDAAIAEMATLQAEVARLNATLAAAASPGVITFRQLLRGLVADQWITAAEASAWATRASLPAPVTAVIAGMPEDQQDLARIDAFTIVEVRPDSPLLLGAAKVAMPEMTDAQIAAVVAEAFGRWAAL